MYHAYFNALMHICLLILPRARHAPTRRGKKSAKTQRKWRRIVRVPAIFALQAACAPPPISRERQECKGIKLAVCTLARNIASRLRASAHSPRTPENKGTKRASRVLVRRVASRLRFRKLPRLFCGRRAKVLLRRLRTCRSFRVPSRTGRGSLFHGYAL